MPGDYADLVQDNTIQGNPNFGLVLFENPDPFPPTRRSVYFQTSGNRIANNVVSGSGRADLALASGSGTGNCFSGNTVGTTLPRILEGCGATGDRGVASALAARLRRMVNETLRRRRPPPYTAMPAPPAQPTMP